MATGALLLTSRQLFREPSQGDLGATGRLD